MADKGYHSGPVLQEMQAAGVRTYIPEKKQVGKRHWVGKEDQQQVVNILKRLRIHVAGANLGLLLRKQYGSGTPRSLQGLSLTLRFFVAVVARARDFQ